MEPDDISLYATTKALDPLDNFTSLCKAAWMTHSDGIFFNSNPLHYSFPLLLLQIFLASGVMLLMKVLLMPFNQPTVVSQILGGIVLGPSFLSRTTWFARNIFPLRGFIVIDMITSFGFMFLFFLVGLQMDPWMLKKFNRKSCALGFFSVALPMLLTYTFSSVLINFTNLEPKTNYSLPIVSQAESIIAFPVIAHFLTELKIINSEFGRIALASSMTSTIFSFCVITYTVLSHYTTGDNYKMITTISTGVAVVVITVFFIRPTILWMICRNPLGEPLKESYIVALLLAILVSGFCCQAIGLNAYFGPFVLGIVTPSGPPVGTAMAEKLDHLTCWVFMPLYFVKNGLLLNIFSVNFKKYLTVQFIAFIGALGKFLGAFLTSFYCHMPKKDAMALGLVMNAQGVLELVIFKMFRSSKAIDYESYVVMCIYMVVVMGVITPLIKFLYDPSKRYQVYSRRTVMHSRPNSELRVLACVHDQENVPTIINLLEALNPSKRSPLSIYLLHLLELVGHSNSTVIPHKLTKRHSSKADPSRYIVNAFRYYEKNSHGFVTVFPFTAISYYKTMHDDVCSIALNKRTSLIIVPFYKNNGAMANKKAIRIMNRNVLDKAPCSVAVLVDRGVQITSRPLLATWFSYRVAVLFFGGADDREALAIGARMAGHPSINLVVIRFLANGSVVGDNEEEKRFDSEVMNEFKHRMAGNYQVMYVEEVVTDGTGTISVIRSMENKYELILVGRQHDSRSRLILGLEDFAEPRELGTIGEVLASAEFLGNTAILVAQQQNAVHDGSDYNIGIFRDKYLVEADAEDMPIRRINV
ncbi:cation/H(+) antiporter 15-like [Quercus lobata]|uniref:Cation/H+ exchanger domain-containing protein n=1 Tax=Quercus lobata TaxID=97700 RepID=A0A7N2QZM0_QUELO|nr:cation/H(+) antiporter 15-like [Quercus lobata]